MRPVQAGGNRSLSSERDSAIFGGRVNGYNCLANGRGTQVPGYVGTYLPTRTRETVFLPQAVILHTYNIAAPPELESHVVSPVLPDIHKSPDQPT